MSYKSVDRGLGKNLKNLKSGKMYFICIYFLIFPSFVFAHNFVHIADSRKDYNHFATYSHKYSDKIYPHPVVLHHQIWTIRRLWNFIILETVLVGSGISNNFEKVGNVMSTKVLFVKSGQLVALKELSD